MGNEKNEIVMLEQQETRDEGILKPLPIVEKTDYSGAYEKTDPREIKLVKKLDRWIMPMLWSMYWLNYLGASSNIDYAHNNPLTLMQTATPLH
jgi:hypothetical protein